MTANRFGLMCGLAAMIALTVCGMPAVSTGQTARTLVIDGSVAPITADPGHMRDVAGRTLLHAAYQTLLGFTSESVTKPEPIVASSYTMSADNKTLTLHIRSGLRFSDGSPLTTPDVLFSLNRVKYLLSQPAFLLNGISITSPAPDTVVLQSQTPVPELPFIVTDPGLGILNSKVVRANGGTDASDAATTDHAQAYLQTHSAGSGPYIIATFSTTTDNVLTANPYYTGPGPKPTYSQIVYRLVPAAAQQLEVQRGTAKIALDLSPSQAKSLADTLNVASHPAGDTWFLLLNQNRELSPVTSNKEFLAAVRAGVDYDRLLQIAGPGNEREASISPQTLAYALPMTLAPKYDVAKAQQLLARSGLSKPTVTLEYADPYSDGGIVYGQIAQAVQASLVAVGINVVLKPTSPSVAISNYLAGKEEFSLWSYSVSPPDPISGIARQFGPGAKFGLRAGWPAGADPEVEGLINQIVSGSAAQRALLFTRFYTSLNTSAPFVPLFASAQTVVSAKSVSNIIYNPQWTIEFAALR